MTQSSTHGFIRIPPDSTGKRIPHSVMCEVMYNSGTVPFVVGDVVECGATGVFGTVLQVVGTTTSGELHVLLNEPVPTTFDGLVGSNILVDDIYHAVIAEPPIPFYFAQNTIAGGKNALNLLDINEKGAASVTFPEGPPQLDAFGKMQVSQQHKLAEYIQRYDSLDAEFTTQSSGTASATYMPAIAGTRLSCGTAAGDKITKTTNEYHVYQAGVSQLVEFTAVLGDSGKPNVVRRMGMFDDNNGVYIEMYETTFNVVLRSNTTGVVVETKVPSSQWSKDRLNGAGGLYNPSKFAVDPTKNNIYWIDYQWLGAGRVRFGMIVNGARIVAHEWNNTNQSIYPYMATGNLPFRVQQENIGISQSTSEMTYYCAVIKTEGTYNPTRSPYSQSVVKNISTTSATPMIGLRPAQTYKTKENRCVLFPNALSLYNNSDVPVIIEMFLGTVATNGSWAAVGGDSAAETNVTMTTWANGQVKFSFIVGPHASYEFSPETFRDNRRGIRRRADITQTFEMMIAAKQAISGTAGDVILSYIWDEMKS